MAELNVSAEQWNSLSLEDQFQITSILQKTEVLGNSNASSNILSSADLLSELLEFGNTAPENLSQEEVKRYWSEGRTLIQGAIEQLFPLPYKLTYLVDDSTDLDSPFDWIEITFEPMPDYDTFLVREAEFFAAMDKDDTVGLVLAKVASALLADAKTQKAFVEAARDVLTPIVEKILQAISRGEVKATTAALNELLDELKDPNGKFFKLLVKKIGKRGALQLIAQVASKFLPFVGWAAIAVPLSIEALRQIRKLTRLEPVLDTTIV